MLFQTFWLLFALALSRGFAVALGLRLGFSLLHRLLGFFDTLGSSFGAFLALFFLQLLAAQQLDKRLLSAVTLLPTSAYDTQLSAVSISETGSDGVEEFIDRIICHEIGGCPPARREIATFAKGDHFFHVRSHGLGFGHVGFHALLDYEGSHQVAQQSATMARITT